VTRYRRSGTVLLLMAPAAPVWGLALRPSGLTLGRALILFAAVLLGVDWLLAGRPRISLPRAVWMLIIGIAAVWVWTAANAETWGCGTCGGDLYGLSELGAICILAAVVCTLEPAVRSGIVLAVLAGGTLEAVLALAGVHGLTPGTADTSSVQTRLAGTFGNPNELGLAIAFSVPAGLAALRIQPPRWRPWIIGALLLIVVALALTLSRSGILAAAAGAALLVVLAQPPRSRRRRTAVAALAVVAAVVGVGYPLFTTLREHAEAPPVNPALRSWDRSGWAGVELGMVATGGSSLSNPATGQLQIGTPRAGQGVSRAIGPAHANGRYAVSFDVRSVSGSLGLSYGLEDQNRLDGPVMGHAVLSTRWRRLEVRWRPTGEAPYARFFVWSPAASPGFILRDVTVAARPAGASSTVHSRLATRLKGSLYAELVAKTSAFEHRDIESRLFAVRAALSAFASQPVRGIGWGRFIDYSYAHGNYGHLPTHDEYLRFLAELGIIGVLLLAFVGAVVGLAVRRGPQDQLGLGLIGLLATGAVGLVFINGLVSPDVMMPLAFAGAALCARAVVRAPELTGEAGTWWPGSPHPLRALGSRRPAGGDRPLAGLKALLPSRPRIHRRERLPAPRPPPAHASDPGTAQSAPSGYRPALDGVRAIAVLAVIGYHLSTRISGGFLGVDVFFVLSGYLITSILLGDLLTTGRIRFAEFWARRARRLLPAVGLLVLVCAYQIHHYEDVGTWSLRQSDLLSTLFYYANWHFIATDQSYFATFLGASPVRHTWTLAIEEQFYLVWPVIVYVTYRMARSLGALIGVIVAGIVGSTIAMAALYTATDPSRAYFGTDTRAATLLVGAGLAVLVARRPGVLAAPRSQALIRWAWVPVAVAMLAASVAVTDHSTVYYDGGALVFALIVALGLFVLEAAPKGPLAAVLGIAPLRWIGRISYSLYLWYWPVLVWTSGSTANGHVRKLLQVVLMFVAATVSYYVVEQPIRSGRMPGLGLSRVRLTVALLVAFAAIALATVQLTTFGSRTITAELAPLQPLSCRHEYSAIGAFDWCLRAIGKPGAPVVASIGDSTSRALYPGMRAAAHDRGWTYIEAAEDGCSVLPLLLVSADTPQSVAQAQRCLRDVPRIIAQVQARFHPDVWVLTDRWPLAPLVTRSGQVFGETDPRRNRPVRQALHAVLRRLTADGARVLLMLTAPPGRPVGCAVGQLAGAACENRDDSVHDPATVELTNNVEAAVLGLARVTVVSIADVVCPGGPCPGIIRGTVVRYDGIHFSGAYSRTLVPVILKRAQLLGLSFSHLSR
jgi:peptidoglycan/LPS O-acetylase OafA/YrhL/O-antigen ligase